MSSNDFALHHTSAMFIPYTCCFLVNSVTPCSQIHASLSQITTSTSAAHSLLAYFQQSFHTQAYQRCWFYYLLTVSYSLDLLSSFLLSLNPHICANTIYTSLALPYLPEQSTTLLHLLGLCIHSVKWGWRKHMDGYNDWPWVQGVNTNIKWASCCTWQPCYAFLMYWLLML